MDLQQHSAGRSILVALAIVFVITTFVLVGLNAWMQQQGKPPIISNPFTQASVDAAYKEGYQAARTKYQALCPMLQAAELRTFSARVDKNQGTTLLVTLLNVDTDEKVDGVSLSRTIKLSPTTVVQKQASLNPDEQMALAKKNSASAKDGTASVVPPLSTVSSTASDIAPGSVIRVSTDQDARLLPTIPASSIVILP